MAVGLLVVIFGSAMEVFVNYSLFLSNLILAGQAHSRSALRCCRASIILAAVIAAGCGPTGAESPADVLAQFIELMARAEGDEQALEDAFGLLTKDAQNRLSDRAEQARTLSGGTFEGWQMLVPGRTRLTFPVAKRGAFRTEIEGARARVTVSGEARQRAIVPLVQEDGHWRIVLQLSLISSGS